MLKSNFYLEFVVSDSGIHFSNPKHTITNKKIIIAKLNAEHKKIK